MTPPQCPKCSLPENYCICSLVPQLSINSQLVILMHHSETHRATSTARLTKLCLPDSEIRPIGIKNQPLDLSDMTHLQKPAYMLFPEGSAQELTEEWRERHPEPITLVVPDGTWSQAKKIAHRSIARFHLPLLKLASPRPSQYRLRRNQKVGNVCTLEAIALALGILEGKRIEEELLSALELLVKRLLLIKGIKT